MTLVAIFFITLLVTSNVILVWYIKRLLNIISDTTEGIEDMKLAIASFSEHLQSIYKQETYYGEPTIERLIVHSKMLVKEMYQFIKVFLVSDPKVEEMEAENNEEKTK
jgi:hypothetical protein